jgi:anti-sigma regulatory factor (Ser/Thr protein kinase)
MPAHATRASEPAADPALLPTWLMLGSVTVPGRPEHVSAARRFVAQSIGDDPRADTALLLTSEVVTNAVLHSRSRLPGGTVAVVVARNPAGMLVAVTDNGSDASVPLISHRAGAEHGNGLLLVETLADMWGYQQNAVRTLVWFRLHSQDPVDCETGDALLQRTLRVV